MKKILILSPDEYKHGKLKEHLHANLIFLYDTGRYFRCVKNRWDDTDPKERIPSFLLQAYIERYAEHFTKEELIDALI